MSQAHLVFALLTVTSTVRADVTHVVQPGHTLEAIAHRYHVSVKAILAANAGTDPQALKPGQTLVIPGVDPTSKKDAKHEGEGAAAGAHTSAARDREPEPRGQDADVVHAARFGEEVRVRVRDSRGHVPAGALATFARMMRQGTATHAVDARLVALMGVVSRHFGGRTIEIVSGFRPYSPAQYTQPHSNHNDGKAVDFRIRGVANEALRDFCRTLRNTGCGYYPNSTFVHLDVRDSSAYWVDWSRPGEAPRYDGPGSAPDEGASDVPDDGHDGANAPGGSSDTPMLVPYEVPTN
jgi:uncharacterized protein YcbK (DUF882 family)